MFNNFNKYFVNTIKDINNSIDFLQFENKITVLDIEFKFSARQ